MATKEDWKGFGGCLLVVGIVVLGSMTIKWAGVNRVATVGGMVAVCLYGLRLWYSAYNAPTHRTIVALSVAFWCAIGVVLIAYDKAYVIAPVYQPVIWLFHVVAAI